MEYRRIPPSEMPPPRQKGNVLRAGERSVLSCDIGLSVCAILLDEAKRRGGFFAMAGASNDFSERAERLVESLLQKLAAMGSNASSITAWLFGGTETAQWQIDRLERALAAKGLSPQKLSDTGGKVYRTFSLDLGQRLLSVAHQAEDASSWSPAKSTLSIHDDVRVFSQNAASGKVANATRFFREQRSFKGLRELVLPEYLAAGTRTPLKVWSACCSSGIETYSYALYLLRLRERTGRDFPFHVYGTDINEELLETAKLGRYEVPPREAEAYGAYFRRWGTLDGLRVELGPEVRSHVSFRPFDIRQRPRRNRFRVIVCANVFQYYNNDARLHFMRNFMEVCEEPGYIYVNNVRRDDMAELGLTFYPAYGFYRTG
jgi:chemotaxis methyl-accepting protein methylase